MNTPQASSVSPLKAFLFGRLDLRHDDRPLPLPPGSAARSLLAYLLLHRRRSHSRQSLVGLFWPENTEKRARRALSQAVWHIRASLPGLLETGPEAIRVAPEADLWLDVEAFEVLLHPAGRAPADQELRAAVRLYRGDLLEEVFDDWALVERERLRAACQFALERLLAVDKAAGNYLQALEHGLALLGSDPLRENAHREVMRLHHLLGRGEAALKQYQACRDALRSGLGLEPEAETTALAREIAQRGGSGLPPYLPEDMTHPRPIQARPVHVALVGRASERARLLLHVEAAILRQGGLLLLEGEAGVGKTRLVQELGRDAEWRGVQVVWGRCQEPESARPFDPLVSAIESGLTPLRLEQVRRLLEPVWQQALGSLLPGLGVPLPSLAAGAERIRLVDGLVNLFSAWVRSVPLLVVLEDIHWAGQDTLDLLPAIAPRLPAVGALILCTYRGEDARSRPVLWDKFQALDRAGVSGRIVLDRLDQAASGDLIRSSLGLASPAPVFEKRLFAETAGNPLFLLETLRALYEERLLLRGEDGQWHTPWDDTTADYAELPLPQVVEQVITRRLGQLPAPLRRTLSLAAALGRQSSFPLLAACSDLGDPALLEALGDLVQRQFLAEDGPGYSFSHDKVRQVTYEAIAPAERVRLHRLAGQKLEALHPEQAEMLAHHYEHGEDWRPATVWRLKAGDQAAALHANEKALTHFDRILKILDLHLPRGGDPGENRRSLEMRCETLARRQRLYWKTGQVDKEQADLEALDALAVELDDPARRIASLNARALFETETRDDYQAGSRLAETALGLSRETGDRRNEAAALDILGRAAYATDRYDQAVGYFTEAAAAWQAAGETAELPQVHIRIGRTFKMMGRLAEARRQFDAALENARAAGNPIDEMYAYTNLAVLARVQGDYQTAIGYNQQALQAARQVGHKPVQATTLDNLGVAYWSLRDYGRAIEAVQESLRLVREMNDTRGAIFCLNNLGDIARETGAFELAETCLSEGLALGREIGFPFAEGCFQQGLGRLRLEQDQVGQARACFEQALAIGQKIGNLALAGNGLCGLGLADSRLGRSEQAVENLENAIRSHTEAGEGDYATCDRSYLAACLAEAGRVDEAAACSRQAVGELESHPGGEEVHQIYYNHWRVMQAAGREAEARDALAKARQRLLAQADSLPDPSRRSDFLERVGVNRRILADWEAAGLVRQATVQLPRAGRGGDLLPVTWTLSTQEDERIPGKVARRRGRLLRLLAEARAQGAEPTHQALADALGAGLRTIERDLAGIGQE